MATRTEVAATDFQGYGDNTNIASASGGGTNWTSLDGVSGYVGITTLGGTNQVIYSNYTAISDAVWKGAGSFTDDQYSHIKIDSAFANNGKSIGVCVRATGTGRADRLLYRAIVTAAGGADTVTLSYVTGTTVNTIATDSTVTWADGDTISLEVEGNALRVYRNYVDSGSTPLINTTDSNIASGGKPGITAEGSIGFLYGDNWSAGNLEAAAATSHKNAMLLGIG